MRGESYEAQAKLEQYLTEELQTKSEFQISIWADTHQMTI